MIISFSYETIIKHKALKDLTGQIGYSFNAPFMIMSFMALPMIPYLKLTDMGLFDGPAFCLTSIWEE